MKYRLLFAISMAILLVTIGCSTRNVEPAMLIYGGTIISTVSNSDEASDIENGYIFIEGDKIVSWGKYSKKFKTPDNCTMINAEGKFIVPGLIDGFGALNNQNYANAYLLNGVTSVVGVSSLRRGELFEDGNPTPNIYKLGDIGDEIISDSELAEGFAKAESESCRVMLLMYKLTPDQIRLSVELAKKHGMATIGELGYTSYKEACDLGVEAFVHTTRYSLDIAPDSLRRAVAEEPFSDDIDSPKWKYYRFLTDLDTDDPTFISHGKTLAEYSGYIMPTLSLLYLDLPDHTNPWSEPFAYLIDRADVNNPADSITGNHAYETTMQNAYTNLALKELEIETAYVSLGAKYIAGSATDVWGTLPGVSLHTELSLLRRIGLSNRQLLSSATSNFASAFGWRRGVIQEGYFADILILNTNPIVDIENLKDIDSVILDGKVLDLDSLK